MEVQINDKNRIRITSEYYAAMELSQKKEWIEYRWFNSLEDCIKYLTQKRLAEREGYFNLHKFLEEYKATMKSIECIFETNKVASDVNF